MLATQKHDWDPTNHGRIIGFDAKGIVHHIELGILHYLSLGDLQSYGIIIISTPFFALAIDCLALMA